MKRHDSCKTCGFLVFGNIFNNIAYDMYYYCEMNNREIEYPRKMGGRDKCPCYMTKAEHRKENKRKIIDNHVYPQKSETKWYPINNGGEEDGDESQENS